MPTFRITDPDTGQKLRITGDSPPTEAELTEIFASQTPTGTQGVQTPPEFAKQAEEVGPIRAGFIGMGRGFTNIGRGLGIVDPATEAEEGAIAALKEQRPITTGVGEVIGEAAPFVIPGTAIAKVPSLVGRVAAGAGLGATEGGLITKGRGEDVISGAGIGGVVGGGAEALFPVVGRLGGSLIRRFTGKAPKGAVLDATGKPSQELQEALGATGISFDDLTQEAVETLRKTTPGASPIEAARLGRLETLGAPATKGDIGQEFAQQAQEARLVESAADPLSDPLRATRLAQSRAFEQQLVSRVDALGVPDDVGESIKSALEGRKKLLSKEKNALYKQVAEISPEVQATPIITDTIAEAVPSAKDLRRISRIQGSQAGAVDDLLVEFGITKDADKVSKFLDGGGEIDQLNVGNFEEFRQALGQIERADISGSTSVIIAPIRNALDEEAGLIDDALRAGGITDESVLKPLQEARKAVRQIKTEFSPEAISGRLIKVKRDGVTPLVETSKVFNELMGAGKAPELIERTIKSLSKTSLGKKAIGDLQARTVVDLMDNAFKAEGRKIAGEKTFGATAFNKRLSQIGDRRLEAVFGTRPDVLKRIRLVAKTSQEIVPPSGAVPKGSANVILDSLNRLGMLTIMGKVPGGALFAETIRTIADKSGNRKVLEKALNAKPSVKKMADFISNEAPGLAAPLGISFLTKKDKKEETR